MLSKICKRNIYIIPYINTVNQPNAEFGNVANFFYVPIVTMGKWLSESFSQINVFIFFLDFIIEAPFKLFVEMFEQWTAYVKERKEDVIE